MFYVDISVLCNLIYKALIWTNWKSTVYKYLKSYNLLNAKFKVNFYKDFMPDIALMSICIYPFDRLLFSTLM